MWNAWGRVPGRCCAVCVVLGCAFPGRVCACVSERVGGVRAKRVMFPAPNLVTKSETEIKVFPRDVVSFSLQQATLCFFPRPPRYSHEMNGEKSSGNRVVVNPPSPQKEEQQEGLQSLQDELQAKYQNVI